MAGDGHGDARNAWRLAQALAQAVSRVMWSASREESDTRLTRVAEAQREVAEALSDVLDSPAANEQFCEQTAVIPREPRSGPGPASATRLRALRVVPHAPVAARSSQ
jgi:hypothetical protein